MDGLYLFGSCARGDSSLDSDLDILSISKNELHVIENLQSLRWKKCNDVSYYSFDKIETYYKQGHLFAWHLYLESKHIDGMDILKELGCPGHYSLFKKDIQSLIDLFESIKGPIYKKQSNNSKVYEAGLLFIVIRNISHSLSWYELEKPSFCRTTPFLLSGLELMGMRRSDYEILTRARHATIRGSDAPAITDEWLIEMHIMTAKWINFKLGSI